MEAKPKILGIIPARYGSTRFPGKPLAMIDGKTMIERVWKQAFKSKALFDVIVATDNEEIYNTVTNFGGIASMTSSHETGTDRCAEVLSYDKEKYDYIINIQGDQPFIQPEQIDLLATLCDGETEIGTLVKKLERKSDLYNPNIVKAGVRGQHIVRFCRNGCNYPFKHIGIYAFRADVLKKIAALPQSESEKRFNLEQLRWLDNGYKIKCLETPYDSISIDTPKDLERIK